MKNERRITCEERRKKSIEKIGNKNKDGGENWEERKREWMGGPRTESRVEKKRMLRLI